MSPTTETNDTPVLRIPRALIVVEGGVVSGTYEDPGVEVRVYDWDEADADPEGYPPLPAEWQDLAKASDAPCNESLLPIEPDRVPRVLVTVSGGVADIESSDGVDAFLLDFDDQKVNDHPITVPERFADLVALADQDAYVTFLSAF